MLEHPAQSSIKTHFLRQTEKHGPSFEQKELKQPHSYRCVCVCVVCLCVCERAVWIQLPEAKSGISRQQETEREHRSLYHNHCKSLIHSSSQRENCKPTHLSMSNTVTDTLCFLVWAYTFCFVFKRYEWYLSDLCSSKDTCQSRCIHSNCVIKIL